MEPVLRVNNVRKTYGTDPTVRVLDGITFDVARGEFVSCFGPNGCGKSTLLSIISGTLKPDSGSTTIHRDGAESEIGFVFQNYEHTLLPWRTCEGNIELPLEAVPGDAVSRKARVAETLRVLGATDLPLKNYPRQLSGGQKQLASIARAIVRRPALLLLDESFSSLDFRARQEMHDIIQRLWATIHTATVFVSHDLDEAIYLADRILVLTPRPARVAGLFVVDLPRPRHPSQMSSPAFSRIREQVLRAFLEAQ